MLLPLQRAIVASKPLYEEAYYIYWVVTLAGTTIATNLKFCMGSCRGGPLDKQVHLIT